LISLSQGNLKLIVVTFFEGGISKNIRQDKMSNCKVLGLSFVCTESCAEGERGEREYRRMNGIGEREVGEGERERWISDSLRG
jgi:hypothetical protein